MKLVSKDGRIVLTGYPDKLREYIQKWFGSKKAQSEAGLPAAAGIVILRNKLIALMQHYSQRGVQMDATLKEQFAAWYASIPSRLSPHITSYRGGYQAKILKRAFDIKSLGCFMDAGGGKTNIGCEFATHIGPCLLVTTPIIWDNAYVGTESQPGDLRFYPHLKVVDATGGRGANWKRAILNKPADLYVVSPFSIGGIQRELLDLPLAGIIWDESSLGRNPGSTRSLVMRSLAAKTDYKLALSADPCPNDVGELWAQMDFLERGRLGSFGSFGSKYGEKTRWGYDFHDIDLALEAVNEVRDRILLIPQERFWPESRKGKVKLHLKTHYVTLDKQERAKYNEMEEDYTLRYGNDIEEVIIAEGDMSRQMKLRELTAGFIYDAKKDAHFIGSASKLRAAIKLIKRRSKEQWIIWAQFVPEGRLITEALTQAGFAVTSLMGADASDPASSTKDNLRSFVERRTQILVSHTSSASHGVRLTNCRNMIFISLTDDNDAVYQATKRIHRPPQTKDCYVYFLVAQDTVDVDILNGLRRKMAWRKALIKKVCGAW